MNNNYLVIERLLQRNGVKPTASGKYRLFDVNEAFDKANMQAAERMRAKGELVLAGLLD
jgi:hypothetical protein